MKVEVREFVPAILWTLALVGDFMAVAGFLWLWNEFVVIPHEGIAQALIFVPVIVGWGWGLVALILFYTAREAWGEIGSTARWERQSAQHSAATDRLIEAMTKHLEDTIRR